VGKGQLTLIQLAHVAQSASLSGACSASCSSVAWQPTALPAVQVLAVRRVYRTALIVPTEETRV
jgi:hypothetical protein